MENFKVGDRVKSISKNCKGEVAFIGETHFAQGKWLGIILDEPKGKHNGTVNGQCYFKCPRTHGVFARPCQVEKLLESAEEGEKPIISNKIVYPNYLKSSSKFKPEKHTCILKNFESVMKPKQKLQTLETEFFEDTSSNFFSTTDEEFLKLISENEDLKTKLKSTESILKDTLQKHAELIDEMKKLKVDLNNRTEQVKVQKCHLKFLKMRECNHYMTMDSLKNKISCREKSGEEKISDLDASLSEDEFDLDSMKALSSMERIVELEEQNRMMIEGLIELREFLKSQNLLKKSPQNMKSQRRLKTGFKRGNTHLSPKRKIVPTANLSLKIDSETQTKEYCNMLQKMTKFTKSIQESVKHGCEKENPTVVLTPDESSCSYERNIEGDFIKNMNFHQNHIDQAVVSNLEPLIENLALKTNEIGTLDSLHDADLQESKLSFKQTSEIKRKSKLHIPISNTTGKEPGFVQELRQLVETIAQGKTEEFKSNISGQQKEALVEEINDSESKPILTKSTSQSKIPVPSYIVPSCTILS